MRENAEAKGRRYLVEGRLAIEHIDDGTITASCRGNGAVYEVTFQSGSWACTCPARGRCAHLVALQLVTSAPKAASA